MKVFTKFLMLLMLSSTLLLSSCSKDDDSSSLKLETTTLSVKSGDNVQIIISPNSSGCNFVSNNPQIASVSADGKVIGKVVGETIIQISNPSESYHAECKVTVTPKYQMYKEPYLGFGGTASQIKSYEKRKLISETSTAIGYEGENSFVTLVGYTLENSKYKGVGVLVPYSSSNATLLANFLGERYLIETDGKDIIFISTDRKIGGGISSYSYGGKYYYQVIYFDVSSILSRSTITKYANGEFREKLSNSLNNIVNQLHQEK